MHETRGQAAKPMENGASSKGRKCVLHVRTFFELYRKLLPRIFINANVCIENTAKVTRAALQRGANVRPPREWSGPEHSMTALF